MSMKNISKALAMAVMMSVFCGSAYAAGIAIEGGMAPGTNAIAIGNAMATSTNAIAIGNGESQTIATDKNAVAIGNDAYAKNENSVALGYGSVTYENDTVSIGSINKERRIVNVAAGTKDTDAVNKGQMDAAIAAIGTGSYDDTAIKTDIADHETRIATLEAGGSGGASTEALEKLDNKINATDARVDRVGATAAALAGINYQPMAKGQSQVAVGLGGYKGKKATAIGMAYQFSDRVSGSVAGAANGSEHMFNIGFNYLFGQHSDKDIAKCAAVPGSMSLKEAELQATVDSQNAKISNLENANAAMQARMAQLEAMVKALAAK